LSITLRSFRKLANESVPAMHELCASPNAGINIHIDTDSLV
jgi:hypothetical protein